MAISGLRNVSVSNEWKSCNECIGSKRNKKCADSNQAPRKINREMGMFYRHGCGSQDLIDWVVATAFAGWVFGIKYYNTRSCVSPLFTRTPEPKLSSPSETQGHSH
jgi:hypothetical protein